MSLTREALEAATHAALSRRPIEPRYVSPREWRRTMRGEARRLGWSRERMREELRAADHSLDPWRVPLPVLRDDAEVFFGFVASERAR